jgi:outer membrane protein OmpA-like peptidoglycan-associated protein
MIKKLLVFFVIPVVLANGLQAQDTAKLKPGSKAPGLILTNASDGIQSYGFPYNNKIVFLFFWSSSASRSKADLYKYSKINSLYSSMDYKSCDGFEMLSVALQSDKNAWREDLRNYGLMLLNNGIALRGFFDFSAMRYNLDEVPAGFLIDETGKIVFVNPDVKTLLGYLNERKNSISSPDVQTKIAGKLLFGKKDKQPLANQKFYLLNEKNDTLHKFVTSEDGSFLLDKINTAQDYHLKFTLAKPLSDEDKVYLAMPDGSILSLIPKKDHGYAYRLLSSDMTFLKPGREGGITTKKVLRELKDLNFTDNLFKKAGTELTKESMLLLDKVVAILKKDPKAHLEIITHTDSKGDAGANMSLSVKRSVAISNYLMAKGIDKSRLKALGKGGSEPLNKCEEGVECSEEELEVNRRTEFRFYKTE